MGPLVSVDDLTREVLSHNSSEVLIMALHDLKERRIDLPRFCSMVRMGFGADLLLTTVKGLREKQQRMKHMRRLRLIGRLAPRLLAAHARAVDRVYAPGGAGFYEAQAQFADAACAQRKRKCEEGEREESSE